MTEMVPSGLMRGRWRRSDGPLEGDTRPKWGETAGPRTPWTPPRQCPTPLVVLCRRRADAEEARRRVELTLQHLGLEAHPEKTRLVDLAWGKESFEFLGCRLRKCRSGRYPGRVFLQRWPSPRSMRRLRARIRELTDARRNGVKDVRVLSARLNPVLRGWGNYFRTGNATRKFTQIDHYVWQRLGLFLARRRGVRRHRHAAVARWSFDWFWGLGLYRLLGTVRYPDAAHA